MIAAIFTSERKPLVNTICYLGKKLPLLFDQEGGPLIYSDCDLRRSIINSCFMLDLREKGPLSYKLVELEIKQRRRRKTDGVKNQDRIL